MPVSTLNGVGPKTEARLQRLGIHSVLDILFHLPLRYQDRSRIAPLGQLRPGDEVQVSGIIQETRIHHGRRRALLVYLSDESGNLILRFFHFSAAQRKRLRKATRLYCFGEVRNGPLGFEMVHPEYHFESQHRQASEQCLTPVYPTTEGLHQLSWRDLTEQALALLRESAKPLPEWLPTPWRQGMPPMSLAQALRYVHRPPLDADVACLAQGTHPAQQRLAFEELVAHQLSLLDVRRVQKMQSAPAMSGDGRLRQALYARLPFALTSAQQRVVDEIAYDLVQSRPMLRLVQGDVGSGKTVVAALAALQVVESGWQVALMAPTELLAEQHYNVLRAWLAPELASVALLTGRTRTHARKAVQEALALGKLDIVVGTQALFQEGVCYHALGLVIIDEQHRFGVHQRLALHEKGCKHGLQAHQLIMTATPIPRSLAMTAYADLDLSVIDELPPGRKPVHTAVVSDTRRHEVIERVRQACLAGRQAYWVCTLIEESEALQCQAAEETAAQLCAELPDLSVGLVHGRMSASEKEHIMSQFKAGCIHVLVATTVIEVGVDVPNASLMIIENSERLGLSQLHQLRGRVGRGNRQSHCLLMYHPPLSQQARQRLSILRETQDGFLIAQKDLELRGPGEILGIRQTGEMSFRIADLLRDQALLTDARQVAEQLLNTTPRAVAPLIERWLGERTRYAHV